MRDPMVKLGEVLKQIDPELVGTPEQVATRFLARNPEFGDLISDELVDLITADVEPDYIWPFHSNKTIAQDREAIIKANEAHLNFLMHSWDALLAMKLGISVQILPQVQFLAIENGFKALQTRMEHMLSMETMAQTVQFTKELETHKADNQIRLDRAKVQNEMDKLWDEARRFFWQAYETLKLRKAEKDLGLE